MDKLILDRTRVLLLAGVAVFLYAAAWIPRNLALAQTGVDARGMPFGGDFIAFWAAGSLALQGRAIEAFDSEVFFATQDAGLPGNAAHFLWNYPPTYHLVVTPFALVGPVPACILWWLITVSLYLVVVGWIVRLPEAPLVALASSAALLNLAHGQNGFLLTAVFLAGVAWVVKGRSLLGGAALGCLMIKPHFAVLVPVALLAARNGTALVGFFASVVVWMLLAVGVFGTAYLAAFVENIETVQKALAGATFPFGKLVSPYVTALTLGIPELGARMLQGAVALGAVVAVFWAWRRPGWWAGAVLFAATPLISPYFYDYDLLLWSGAAVCAYQSGREHGFRPGQAELWVPAACLPVFMQALWASTGVQFGGLACVALLAALFVFRPR